MSESTSVPGADPAGLLARRWREASRPDLDAFLAGADPLEPAALAAVLRVDRHERWRAGQYVPVETYLSRYPAVRADADGAVDLVYGEFLLREQRGEAPRVDEYVWRFPEYAAVLGPQIELHRALATAEAGADDATQSGGACGEPGAGPREGPAWPQVPGYAILGEVGRGGMGVVYQARQMALGRDVALKELLPERAGHAALGARFLQEARITGQLEHPGVVPVYELVRARDGRQPFYTMRFVKGRTLSEAAHAYHDKRRAGQEDALEWPALLNAFVTVCNTVAYAHSRAVLHRDLKGQNIVLGDFGEVVVLDWGLAKVVGRPEGEAGAPAVEIDETDGGHTVQGQALGTPAYMAPEQSDGRLDRIDRHTDVYGLGAILYEVLTGVPPFSGDSTAEVLRKVREEAPAPPRQFWPDVPPALEALCLRALAKRPQDRPAAAADLAQEVQGWQEMQRRQAEEALRRQTQILQSILNTIQEGVFVTDKDGRWLLCNPAAEAVCGPREAEATPDQWKARIGVYLPDRVTPCPTEDLPQVRALRGEEVHEAERFMRNPHVPEGIFLSVNASPLRDENGALRGAVSVFRNITQRKLAEEELRKSQERFELAVQGSQDGLWDWDLTTDEVYYSPRYKAMLGYEDHELPNRSEEWAKRVHPDDLERVRGELRAHFKGRESLSWVEFRMRHKDGSYRWVRSRAFVLRDAAGRVYRMAGSHEDITDRKNAEEELAYERYLLRSLMDTSPDSIVFKDREGRHIRVNPTLVAKLGLDDPSQVIGKTVHDLFEEEYARQSDAEEQEIIRTGQPVVAKDVNITWPDGRATWGSVTKMPLRDPQGRIIGTFAIVRDITERKHAEEELAHERHLLSSFIDALPEGIYFKDRESRFIRANRTVAETVGCTPAQLVGKTDFDYFAPEVARQNVADEQEIIRTGRPVVGKEEKVTWRNGLTLWVSSTRMPLRDPDGRIVGTLGITRDITQRKLAEEALRQSEEQYRSIVAAMQDGALRQRLEQGERLANPGQEEPRDERSASQRVNQNGT
jgi:PAS domain S-box-containing protein